MAANIERRADPDFWIHDDMPQQMNDQAAALSEGGFLQGIGGPSGCSRPARTDFRFRKAMSDRAD
jgi:hypothetical protein